MSAPQQVFSIHRVSAPHLSFHEMVWFLLALVCLSMPEHTPELCVSPASPLCLKARYGWCQGLGEQGEEEACLWLGGESC